MTATANIATSTLKSTGSTTSRSYGDRLADVINVKDYGALGNGIADDYAAVQASLDAAFGTAASPHGAANATLNRPVFFPNGSYLFSSGTPTLTRVVGGRIFGAGSGATFLSQPSGAAVIATNGCANLVMERFTFTGGTVCCLDLDWDNTAGGDGLHNNYFSNILMANSGMGVRIAHSGNGGSNNLFQQVSITNMTVAGIDAQAASATNNMSILGGVSSISGPGYFSSLGSIHTIEASVAANSFDIRVDSGLPVMFIGGRTESIHSLKVTSGFVTVRGMVQSGGTEFANITGGKVTIDGCVVSSGGTGQINGNGGSLYLRGNTGFSTGGYSGTIVQNI